MVSTVMELWLRLLRVDMDLSVVSHGITQAYQAACPQVDRNDEFLVCYGTGSADLSKVPVFIMHFDLHSG